MKTIKQIADEIGVSKQAVFYRINKPPLSNALENLMSKENGVLMVSFDGEMLIKREFSDTDRQTVDDKESSNKTSFDGSLDSDIIKLLRETIDTLKEQLSVKDKQLEEKDKQITDLTEANKNLSQSINADRHNALAETIIDTKSIAAASDGAGGENKKRGFWRFWKK